MNELSLGEVEYLENELEVPLNSFIDPETGSGRIPEGVRTTEVMRVLATIALRRSNPDITPEEIDDIKLTDLPAIFGVKGAAEINPPGGLHSS